MPREEPPLLDESGLPAAEPASRVMQALDEVEARMGARELRSARRALTATLPLLGPSERARAEALEWRLGVLERLQGPTLDYQAAIARDDSLAARDAAARAATAAGESDEAAVWRARAAEARARVRAEWRIGEADLDIEVKGPVLADGARLICPALCEALPLLTDHGATLVLVSAWERWVFVREVDVERRHLRRIAWLRAPEALDDPAVQVDGDVIHLVSSAGHLLALSRRPLDIVSWLSLRPFMLPDRCVDGAFLPPSGGHLWAQLKEPHEDGGLTVIDLEEWRVGARIYGFDWASPVAGARPPRVLATSLDDAAGLYEQRGARVTEPSLDGLRVLKLVAHPGGDGLLALAAVWGAGEDEDEPSLGLVELRRGQAQSPPLLFPETSFEQLATLAVSLVAGRAFLLTELDGQNQLVAYRPGLHGIEEAWRVAVSDQTVLVRDGASQTVLALTSTGDGLAFAVLGKAPIQLQRCPFGRLMLGIEEPPSYLCEPRDDEMADPTLRDQASERRRDGGLERWAEARRRERRKDPVALDELIGVLLSRAKPELAERVLALSLERHPAHPQLRLRQADVAAISERWDEVERLLLDLDPAALPEARACHVHHLRGLARLHAGDAGGAKRCFESGAQVSGLRCSAGRNLDLADALCHPLDALEAEGDTQSEAEGSTLRQLVLACRLADHHLARGEDAAARDLLDRPLVHADLELQSAARLAEAHLAHQPATPQETIAKLVALSRISTFDPTALPRFSQIPGLGWDTQRLSTVTARARAWLEEFARPPSGAEPRPATPTPSAVLLQPLAVKTEAPVAPGLHDPHRLPPLGHEAMRQLVPGLDEAVRQAVRYTRAQPGWDESQTLGEDLLELDPLRHFAASHLAWLASSRMEPEEASAAVVLLGKHLDYCVNFELCRRKCFLVDAPLAWLLGLTSLDIEGRMLRLPFACFAVVFTDRATLEIAEALLQPPGGELVEGRLHILTAYVTRTQAPRGTSGLRLSMVFDSRCGEWPYLLVRELRFTDDDDLDAMLDRVGQGAEVDASGRPLDQAKTRRLIHLLVNAILYANSADLPWPLAPSPIRALQAKAQRRGEAKQARVAHRAQELRKQYSEEDVFFLPGRIPISQLRALREVEQGPRGGEVMARFMVRGHWRRAAKGWVNQRLRWIEPYWKGPEWGPIMEKDYRLKV